jgi:hypothetical protein
MSAITLKDDQLLFQLEKMLVKYGQAEALGDTRRRLEHKKSINTLAEELLRRGYTYPYIRTIP